MALSVHHRRAFRLLDKHSRAVQLGTARVRSLELQEGCHQRVDERGLYEHEFTVPAGWSGRRVFLVFEGVMTDTSAKLNGQSVGPMHQGGFYRFKYEVTPLVKFGATNRLEVTVAKHSANDR